MTAVETSPSASGEDSRAGEDQRRAPVPRYVEELDLHWRVRSVPEHAALRPNGAVAGLCEISQIEVGHDSGHVESRGNHLLRRGLGEKGNHCTLKGSSRIANGGRQWHFDSTPHRVEHANASFLSQRVRQGAGPVEHLGNAVECDGRLGWIPVAT